eukprot:GILJ01007711.1.p1 GENE.GILJ01007711.1~~GILJ01007711.1.p1  ORF type:complete len:454 (-),score=18.07 GILJ01007711.1:158-1411(-)
MDIKVVPFHTFCPLTNQAICRCAFHPDVQTLADQQQLQTIYQQLWNHYKGISEEDQIERARIKQMEAERILFAPVSRPAAPHIVLPQFDTSWLEEVALFEKKICFNCQTTRSDIWRKGWDGEDDEPVTLCNQCGLRFINGEELEMMMGDEFLSDDSDEGPNMSLGDRRGSRSTRRETPGNERRKASEKPPAICHWQKCMSGENPQDLLWCATCSRAFHAKCCEPPLQVQLVKRFTWHCNECKKCERCHTNRDEKSILICDACDRGFHATCLSPPLKRIPARSWYCYDCGQCYSCHQPLPKPTATSKFHNNYRVCEPCQDAYTSGRFCPVCDLTYADNDTRPFVQCDFCEKWIHADCDGLDPRSLARMSKSATKYKCPTCRQKDAIPTSNLPPNMSVPGLLTPGATGMGGSSTPHLNK